MKMKAVSQMLRVARLVVAVTSSALLLPSCGHKDKLVNPVPPLMPPGATAVDSAIVAAGAVVTTSSSATPTPSGNTSSWAGLASSAPSDVTTAGSADTSFVDGTRWVCEEHERKFSAVNSSFPLLDGNSDVYTVGQVLQGKSLYRATPDPVTAPRGPGVVVWSQINGSALSSVHVSSVTLANVKKAADSLIAAQPSAGPSDIEVSLKQVRSMEDLQIAINASAEYFGLFGASASFSLADNTQYSYYLVTIRQKTFSLLFQRPELPHEFFAKGVSLAAIAPHIGPSNPPAYVSRVTYGRVFYMLVRSTERAEEMQATLNANFSLGLFGSDVGGSVGYVTHLKNLDVQWYVYGGSTQQLASAVAGGLDALKAFKAALQDGNDFKLSLPLFATVRSVATDELVQNGYLVGYTYRDCSPSALCAPTLITPGPGALNVDNGCRCDPNSVLWSFTWSSCPGTTQSQLQITHPDYGVIDHFTTASSFNKSWPSALLKTTGWHWRVRSKIGVAWGPWSALRAFSVEPVDSDCKTGIQLYADDSFRTPTRFIDLKEMVGGAIKDLAPYGSNNNLSSIKLYNIKSATVFQFANFGGRNFVFDHNCPDVLRHLSHGYPHDIASALKVQSCP